MLNCFSNYGRFGFDFEAGRHAVWKGAGDKPSAKPPTPEEQLAASQAELKRLRASMGLTPSQAGTPPVARPSADLGTHEERMDTRTIEAPKPRYQATVEAAEKALALKGYLPPAEVIKIQTLHEHMYQQYLNPGFMLYIQRKQPSEVFQKVYDDLNQIFKTPYDFSYIDVGNNRTEIHKRETSTNTAIRNDFLVVLETKDGYITEAGGKNLKNDKSQMPWMQQPEYNRQMPNYAERWQVESERTGGTVTEEMKEIFLLNNKTFPTAFLALVDSRGFEFEQTDPQIAGLRRAFERQRNSSYDEITADPNGPNWRVGVTQDPEAGNEGGYQIYYRDDAGQDQTIHVSKQGYIMQNTSVAGSPNWIPHPLYTNAVRWQYYTKYPEAVDLTLTDDEKRVMTQEQGQVRLNEAEIKKREKRRKVDEALAKADLAKLKEAAKFVVDPNDPTQSEIDAAKDTPEDKQMLIDGVKYYFDPANAGNAQKADANIDKVAVILNVPDAPTTPTTPPVTTP